MRARQSREEVNNPQKKEELHLDFFGSTHGSILASNVGGREIKSTMHAYLLTPWSRVPFQKLIGFQLVKKFPAFYGTRRFITAVKSARHLSIS